MLRRFAAAMTITLSPAIIASSPVGTMGFSAADYARNENVFMKLYFPKGTPANLNPALTENSAASARPSITFVEVSMLLPTVLLRARTYLTTMSETMSLGEMTLSIPRSSAMGVNSSLLTLAMTFEPSFCPPQK